VVVRETAPNIYTGTGGQYQDGNPNEVAIQEMVYTDSRSTVALKYAFEYTKKATRTKP
jgi:isocitrate/isopropylmalate dehydrogenase